MRPLLRLSSYRGFVQIARSRYPTRISSAATSATSSVSRFTTSPRVRAAAAIAAVAAAPTAKADTMATNSSTVRDDPFVSVTVTQPGRLGPVPEDTDQKTHHVKDASGKTTHFMNPHPSFRRPAMYQIFFLMLGYFSLSYRPHIIPAPKPKGDEVEVVQPELLQTRSPAAPEPAAEDATPADRPATPLRATWLGHACQYVEFPSGLRVLFDPVLDDFCAPVKLPWLRRYTAAAAAAERVGAVLPFVDAVCISHSHYDHLSLPTVQALRDAFPRAHFFVGLGLRRWMVDEAGVDAGRVTEMDWWEDAELTLTPGAEKKDGAEPVTARFSCLPCQHESGRSSSDRAQTLWCSWGVASGATPETTRSVWFAGDTGYRAVPRIQPSPSIPATACAYADDHEPASYPDGKLPPHNPQFAQIGQLRGPFDLGLIPIGAYAPRHVFSGVHADPFDAVDMFADARCRRAVAIHWGSWILTPEEVLEPPRLLREALRRKDMPETGVFDVCKVGETVSV